MTHKLLALLICGSMILFLASCSTNNPENTLNQSPAEVTDTSEFEDADNDNSPSGSVFPTENITRITFFGYYGDGKGIEVPAETMDEVTAWLGTFVFDNKAGDMPPPGANTYYVEIEYSDATIIKEGLDIITVDGVAYCIKHAPEPECVTELILNADFE